MDLKYKSLSACWLGSKQTKEARMIMQMLLMTIQNIFSVTVSLRCL
jgi:hypothetical protein